MPQLRSWVWSLLQERCAAPNKEGNSDDDSDTEKARWRSLEAMLEGECKLDGADGDEDCSSYWDERDSPKGSNNNRYVHQSNRTSTVCSGNCFALLFVAAIKMLWCSGSCGLLLLVVVVVCVVVCAVVV